jgi:hypothetical protein
VPRPDWGKAATYYKLAARVLPGSGHPHNQLAVMAFYTGDELRAVTYYCRALAARVPFLTARENLHLLFEQNRARWGGGREQPPVCVRGGGGLQGCLQLAVRRCAAGLVCQAVCQANHAQVPTFSTATPPLLATRYHTTTYLAGPALTPPSPPLLHPHPFPDPPRCTQVRPTAGLRVPDHHLPHRCCGDGAGSALCAAVGAAV